ncbi:hypothetical protein BHE90_014217 [Fusarium euwallaceae]|uniref:Uncharacterized protein n=1 Tax=Fusarium euwallaceae TaxID=1147111 RepID=A0A430L6L8_9HYPO|nr:hypothetical protein BHE90_014217 [Fusarium euwallaceae]
MGDTSGGITTVRAESPLIKREEPERSMAALCEYEADLDGDPDGDPNDHWLKLGDEDDKEKSKIKADEDTKEIKIKIKADDDDEEKSKLKADEDDKEKSKIKADEDTKEIKFKVNHEDSKGDSDNESIYGGDTEHSDWADDGQVNDDDCNNGSDDDDDSDYGSSGGTHRPKRSKHRWSNNASQPDFEDWPENQCPCGASHLPANCPERLLETYETDAIPTINNPSPVASIHQTRNVLSQPEENIPIDPALSDPTRPACISPEPPAAKPSSSETQERQAAYTQINSATHSDPRW